MRFILIIIGTILLLDITWWLVSARLCHGTSLARLNHLFLAAEMVGLLWLILGRLGRVDIDRWMPKVVVTAVFIWHMIVLPIVVSLLIVVLPVLLVGLGFRYFRPAKPSAAVDMARRQFFASAVAVLPPLVTLGLTGVALRQLTGFRIRRMTLPISNLPEGLQGKTIAHVSDIHVGRFTSGRVLEDMVRAVNDLQSDLVLFMGDLINDELADLDHGIELLGRMRSRYGTVSIEGNHDLIENGPEFERRMKASGIPFLLDESKTLDVGGVPVQLLGLSWTRTPEHRDQAIGNSVRKLIEQRDPNAFGILMAHHPHAFDAAADANVPLILSGHTHGGQLMLNSQFGFGPALFRYWSGVYERNLSKLVVSNGVGNWFPLRVQAPAEIIHLTLVRA